MCESILVPTFELQVVSYVTALFFSDKLKFIQMRTVARSRSDTEQKRDLIYYLSSHRIEICVFQERQLSRNVMHFIPDDVLKRIVLTTF